MTGKSSTEGQQHFPVHGIVADRYHRAAGPALGDAGQAPHRTVPDLGQWLDARSVVDGAQRSVTACFGLPVHGP